MIFLFAGGVEQQVRRVLNASADRCIRCASAADLVEYEKVLKLFFVPVWRWPGKEPALHCPTCSLFFPTSRTEADQSPPLGSLRCCSCARTIDPAFRFCPFCGSSL